MKIIYHDDNDGQAAAAIAYHALKERGEALKDSDFLEADYGMPLPLVRIEMNEPVYLLDFSPTTETAFRELLSLTDDVVWIDHQKALDNLSDLSYLRGNRSPAHCAAVLTWQYFYQQKPLPQPLHDVENWELHTPNMDKRALYFHHGLVIHDTRPTAEVWRQLLFTHPAESLPFAHSITNQGQPIYTFRQIQIAADSKLMFDAYLDGIPCSALNTTIEATLIAETWRKVKPLHNILIAFQFTGLTWHCELRSLAEHAPNLDQIASKFGGSGNPEAARFNYNGDIMQLLGRFPKTIVLPPENEPDPEKKSLTPKRKYRKHNRKRNATTTKELYHEPKTPQSPPPKT